MHLPFSPGGTSDDKRLVGVEHFLGQNLIVTEKMDGSNTCLEAGGCYARSHGAAPNHPSFDAFKAFHATVKSKIPENFQIFGEWCFAKHSILYSALPTYFQVFGVRDLRTWRWGSWAEVEMWAEEIGCVTVPVLGRESGLNRPWKIRDLVEMHAAMPSRCGGEREGVVIRIAEDFHDDAFGLSVAKWVRAGHVQTDEHWKNQAITRNVIG